MHSNASLSPLPEPQTRLSSPGALVAPGRLKAETPLSASGRSATRSARRRLARILAGEDDQRLIVICGPCSIHDINSAVEYADKLRKLARAVENKVEIVMRTYFEKPRSVIGWKGFLYDPDLDGSSQANAGLKIARRLLVRLNDIGLPCATEFLNPILAPYIEDAIAYGAIGSRTAESQIHRELASRLPMPIGIKNGMDGRIRSSLDGVRAARERHFSFSIDEQGHAKIEQSRGNPLAHPLLRGGHAGPNYSKEICRPAAEEIRSDSLGRPVMVDCSHGNSGKNFRKQGEVARSVAQRFARGERALAGIMLESNLVEGNQPMDTPEALRYGQSITDSCIGWRETEELVREIAAAV